MKMLQSVVNLVVAILNPVFIFRFSTTHPFEDCPSAIRSLQRRLHWWNRSSFNAETSVIVTPLDSNSVQFDFERIPYRFIPIRATGYISRGDGVFTEISGQVTANNAWFILDGAGITFLAVLIWRIELAYVIMVFVPLAFVITGFTFVVGYLLTNLCSQRLIRDIQSSVGYQDGPMPIHRPEKKKKKPA
jgi:hypothetical protein